VLETSILFPVLDVDASEAAYYEFQLVLLEGT
jgi:hypothetical protein